MVFSSILFLWIFLPIVLIGNRIMGGIPGKMEQRRTAQNRFLLLASLVFYGWGGIYYLLLMLAVILINYVAGLSMEREESRKQLSLILAIVLNLGLLGYFKYFNLLISTIETVGGMKQGGLGFKEVILPIGISFYIFQAMSYTIDVYRGKTKVQRNLPDFALYVSLFPQLVAGPIVRADQFIPQLYKPFFLGRREFGIALFWILNGLCKKLILSDYLAVSFVDRVFANPLLYTPFENFSALLVYSLQVYADFSGYTDIAIGVAMLMGFYLPLNFNSPYKATNAAGFWKRWHISLSNWLKDYLYIPLGGNRNSTPGTFIIPTVMLLVVVLMAKNLYVTAAAVALVVVLAIVYAVAPRHRKEFATNLNNFDTMLLGGMWHGASFNFITWGALNGLGILVYKWWKKKGPLYRIIAIALIYVGVKCLYHFFPIPVLSMFHFALMVTAAAIILLNLVPFVAGRRYRESKFKHGLNTVWNTFLTFIFISFTRLFFRSGSNLDPAEANETAWRTATQMVERIGGHWNWQQVPDILANYAPVFIVFLIGMIIHWLPDRFKRRYRLWFAAMPLPVMLLAVVLTVFIVYQFITADLQPFIYFQF